jgi:hypothetical protein
MLYILRNSFTIISLWLCSAQHRLYYLVFNVKVKVELCTVITQRKYEAIKTSNITLMQICISLIVRKRQVTLDGENSQESGA